MRRNLLCALAFAVIIVGCSKSKTPGPTDTGSKNPPKLEIVSGNNQSAKVGFYPADTIKVKAAGDGFDHTKYYIEFKGSGCNADLPQNDFISAEGVTAVAYYRLAGNVGAQTLQATLVEVGTNKRIDSVTFSFTATAPTAGLNYAACTPPAFAPRTFCKTGSGRLFAVFGSGKVSARYSDDEGISWYPVKDLGTNHSFESVRSDGKNQVVLFAYNEGLYYSADNGATWQLRPNGPFKEKQYGSMTYTSSGKLFFIPRFDGVYYSEDNGLTWSKFNLRSDDDYWTGQEGPGGEFYVFGEEYGLYKSIDKGKNWVLLPNVTKGMFGTDGMFAFYVDQKTGFIYKSAQQPSDGFWISTDGGENYHSYLTSIPTLANYITKFNDILYFQSVGDIYKIDSPNHAVKLHGDLLESFDGNFIVSDHNNLVCPGSVFIDVIR